MRSMREAQVRPKPNPYLLSPRPSITLWLRLRRISKSWRRDCWPPAR